MNKHNQLPNVVLYLRYSSRMQREDSLEEQKKELDKFCEGKYHIAKVYADSAQTGTNDRRKYFQEMINDCVNRNPYQAVAIVVYKRDRMFRNRLDAAQYKKKLAEVGIKIISALERLDDSPESIILEGTLDSYNEYYSRCLGILARRGLVHNAETCRTTGSTAPLGLKVNKDTLKFEIDEHNADAIRILFDRFVNDRYSYKQIADELNSKGFRTSRGNMFTNKSCFVDMLSNTKYKGTLTYLKSCKNPITGKRSNKHQFDPDEIVSIENAIPAIIDDDTFNKAQELLIERKKRAGSYRKTNRVNLFTSKLVCGKCGCLMNMNTRKSGTSKQMYSTYRCTGKNEKMASKCINKEISTNHLERYVISQLMYYLKREDTLVRITSILNDSILARSKHNEIEIKNVEQRINSVEIKIKNITNAIADGVTTGYNALLEKLKALEEEMNDLQSQKIGISSNIDVLKSIQLEEVAELINKARDYMESGKDELIRVVISLFIEKIVVGENSVEIIYYLHPFSYVGVPLNRIDVTRKDLKVNKGFNTQILKGKWSKKKLVSLSESKPTLARIISLVA